MNSERSNPRKNGWQWTILCGVSTRKAVSYCAFELNKNNSMNFIVAYIAVSFSAFADHGFTRFYLDKSSTIKPKWPPWSPRDQLRAIKSKEKWMTLDNSLWSIHAQSCVILWIRIKQKQFNEFHFSLYCSFVLSICWSRLYSMLLR